MVHASHCADGTGNCSGQWHDSAILPVPRPCRASAVALMKSISTGTKVGAARHTICHANRLGRGLAAHAGGRPGVRHLPSC